MEIDDFSRDLKLQLDKIINSDLKKWINITIENYYLYNLYFTNLQNKLVSEQIKSQKLNVLNYFHMHSTYIFSSLINSIMTDDYLASHIILRTLLEFYIKYSLILYSDEYVAQLFLDFNNLYKSNLVTKYNLYDFAEEKNKLDSINEMTNLTLKKYNISAEGSADRWIKLALNHNRKTTKSRKSVEDIIKWLKEIGKLDKTLECAYGDECDFVHCSIFSMDALQLAYKNNDNNTYSKKYITIITTINYLSLSILNNFMLQYSEYKDDETLGKSISCMDKIERMINEVINNVK